MTIFILDCVYWGAIYLSRDKDRRQDPLMSRIQSLELFEISIHDTDETAIMSMSRHLEQAVMASSGINAIESSGTPCPTTEPR